MKRVPFILITLAAALLLFNAGCAAAPQPHERPPEEPVAPADPEPEAPAEPAPAEPADPATPPEEEAVEPQEFEVSEEVFERTFSEVEQTISELNSVIARRDYQRWLDYLTPEYRRTYSDPQTLREISRMPILQRNEIELQSLRDYFEWVVGPSRADARLDDLRFLSNDQVEAIMVVRGRPVILYHLRNVDGSWKVDVF